MARLSMAGQEATMAGAGEAFAGIGRIRFEGPTTRNMLAFRHYDADALVEGKPMKDHLRFAVSYWHAFRGTGADPFGPGTMLRPWENESDPLKMAVKRVDVAFEFLEKLGVGFYCFHDRDVAPEGATLAETNENLDVVVAALEKHQQRTGIRLLWGTANLFSNPRYVHGAATSPNAESFAYAAAQVKKAIEVTHRLGGAGYTFWGGREGYQCLWNTDMKRELDHLAKFMHMAVDFAQEIGFTGQFYFEPKPREPMKHQYDFDAAACINFLRAYGLERHVKLNLETNHATLAGHEMQHELEYAGMQGFLGSVDANTGDTLVGWDTDQFPTNVYLTTQMMYTILKHGGLAPGGVNFDAKVRRESFEPVDLFHAHIGGMDAFARGLKIAAAMRADGAIERLVAERYASWSGPLGKRIESGTESFKSLEAEMLAKGEAAACTSGRQELFENVVNSYL
jgi:xylose isomerase